jgi:hypothetical protein
LDAVAPAPKPPAVYDILNGCNPYPVVKDTDLGNFGRLSTSKDAAVKEFLEKNKDSISRILGGTEPRCPEAAKDVEHLTTLALDKAKEIVCGDRARDYGRPSENHGSTAGLWNAYLRLPPGFLDERDVCVMNILQKMSRDRWSRIDDNPVDWAGYAQNASWIGDPRGGKNLGALPKVTG